MKRALPAGLALLAAAVVVSVAGCAASSSDSFDKNTNWLESCTDSEACGVDLQCVCGVCTSLCDRDAQCAGLDQAAICMPLATMASTCASPQATSRVCSLPCADNASCTERSNALSCVAGSCALDETLTPDASMQGTDATIPPDIDSAIGPGPSSVPFEPSQPLLSSLTLACGNGFACEAYASAPHGKGILPTPTSIYFTDWGSVDAFDNNQRDGALKRIPRAGGDTETLLANLDRPWRLWIDGDFYYWLSGEPRDTGTALGMQVLFEAPIDGSAPPDEVVNEAFERPYIQGGDIYWLAPYSYLAEGDSVQIKRYSLSTRTSLWGEFFVQGDDYVFAGLDDTDVYLEDGALNIARGSITGNIPTPFIMDTPAYSVTVASDALWLVHTGADGRQWVSSMTKDSGAITHAGDATEYYGRPQPGTSVVWIVTSAPGAQTWQLWSMPKTGGERKRAFSWATKDNAPREEAEPPVWVTDGDDVWLIAFESLVRVHKP